MKKLIFTVAFALTVAYSLPAVATTGSPCKGDANRSSPPVVNNPWHIRNIVWRNMQEQCFIYKALVANQIAMPTTIQVSPPSPQQVQPQAR